jgi:predicted methyltransferase
MMRFLAFLILAGCAAAPAPSVSPERIAAIVASPDRSAADRTNDLRRKPAEMLAFIGVREGMVVLDISAAGGYTTELIARAVGPGRVYGQTRAPDPRQRLAERAKNPAAGNIVPVVRPFDNPVPPEVAANGLDLVTLMFNYHDFANIDRAQMNRYVFAALKPGGLYIVADHSGRAGTGISESNTLHRIEEAFLRKEVEAAGFQLVAEGGFLRNPNDPRDRETPEPAQPKDEFILKFRKP